MEGQISGNEDNIKDTIKRNWKKRLTHSKKNDDLENRSRNNNIWI